jgi:hypothetical protein
MGASCQNDYTAEGGKTGPGYRKIRTQSREGCDWPSGKVNPLEKPQKTISTQAGIADLGL